ncbi:MAG: glycerol-3-phosphate 1-O-acyltransferase PlsY [Gammaproteobacteria bacterium]
MIELLIKVVIAYLIGSINGALVLGRFYLKGVDIREEGSGNAGGTNAFRSRGPMFAAGVVAIDVLKGFIAAGFLPGLFRPDAGIGGMDLATVAAFCGLAVIIGHCYPVFFGFRGGKGVATLIGVLAAISPAVLLVMLAVGILTLLLSGYVSLASIVGTAATVPASLLFLPISGGWAVFWFSVFATALIVLTHRDNMQRMRDGTEGRFESVWLMRR